MTHNSPSHLSAEIALAREYHPDGPCDCYEPDQDRPKRECAAWADNILAALKRAGYSLWRTITPEEDAANDW